MSLNYHKCLVRNNYASLKNMSSANILHEVVNVRSGTKISLDKTVIFNRGRFNSAVASQSRRNEWSHLKQPNFMVVRRGVVAYGT